MVNFCDFFYKALLLNTILKCFIYIVLAKTELELLKYDERYNVLSNICILFLNLGIELQLPVSLKVIWEKDMFNSVRDTLRKL